MFVFDSSNYEICNLCYFESIHQNAAPSTWTYVLFQAVVGMAEGSLCYPNSKNTKWTFIVLTLRQRHIDRSTQGCNRFKAFRPLMKNSDNENEITMPVVILQNCQCEITMTFQIPGAPGPPGSTVSNGGLTHGTNTDIVNRSA